MNKNLDKYKITILRPGGNDTALVEGIVAKADRQVINDSIMLSFPNVEQVGFYEYDVVNAKAVLEMAGGEFCGNATRSLAYLLLEGKNGELSIKVSGTKRSLKAGISEPNTAFSSMPIYGELSSVQKLDRNLYQVELEGITHLITRKPKNLLFPEDLKKRAKELLEQKDLLYSRLASGVMFISESKNRDIVSMEPVVWVRDIKTLFYETACASGATAVGLWKSKSSDKSFTELDIIQPSKQIITASIEKNGSKFVNAVIDGPVTILEETA